MDTAFKRELAAAYEDSYSGDLRLLQTANENEIVASVTEMLVDQEVIPDLFIDSLVSDLARSETHQAHLALRKEGFRTTHISCSKGMVSVKFVSFTYPPIPITPWNLDIVCCFQGGKVTKTGRGNVRPVPIAVIFHVPGIIKVTVRDTTARLHYAQLPLMDTRPVVRALHRVATFHLKCTKFEAAEECASVMKHLWEDISRD